MVSTRGKKKTGSSKETVENEAAQNALTENQTFDSQTVKEEGRNLNAEFEDEKRKTVDEDRNEEELYAEETEKVRNMDHDDEIPGVVGGIDGDAEWEQNTSDNDEIDDQEDELWEDDDEDSEDKVENLADKDKVGEDETTEDQDDWEGTSEEAVGEEDSTEVGYSEEESMEDVADENTQKDEEFAEVGGKDTEDHNEQKVNVSLKKMEKSSERREKLKKMEKSSERSEKLNKMEGLSERIRKKVRARKQKNVETRDKPESSSRRKVKKRVASMGMIFMCSSKTKKDCYQYRVLGLPESKKDIVGKIYAGMRLFLYDVDLKLMYGIYKAAGPGGFNIEPKAFKSRFPSQVRFSVLDDCSPLPEEKFKKVLKENYYTNTKFDCKLNSEQVKKLCKLFVATRKGKQSNKFGRLGKSEKSHPMQRESDRKQRAGDKRRLAPKEDLRHHERPSKHPRRVINPVVPRHRTPPPPLSATLYAHGRTSDVDAYRRDPYLESHSDYRERRDPIISRRDTYRDWLGAPTEHDRYRDRRDVSPVSRYAERDRRDPYILRHDPYRDAIDPYPEHRLPHREGRDSYLDRRDPYRGEREQYVRIRDSYRDERGSYLDRRDTTYSLPYSTINKRDPLSDRNGAYREFQGVDYRDSYRRELPEHDPLSLATRRRDDVGSRDLYAALERTSYGAPIYSSYPPRAGTLAREYHL